MIEVCQAFPGASPFVVDVSCTLWRSDVHRQASPASLASGGERIACWPSAAVPYSDVSFAERRASEPTTSRSPSQRLQTAIAMRAHLLPMVPIGAKLRRNLDIEKYFSCSSGLHLRTTPCRKRRSWPRWRFSRIPPIQERQLPPEAKAVAVNH